MGGLAIKEEFFMPHAPHAWQTKGDNRKMVGGTSFWDIPQLLHRVVQLCERQISAGKVVSCSA